VLKVKRLAIITLLFAVIALASFLDARPWRDWKGSGGWGHKSDYQRMYNPINIATVKGVVEAVEQITPIVGMCQGIHIKLTTDSEVKSVHLGPSWFIERQDIKIEKGDTIEATGSRIEYKGEPVIVAAEIKKEDTWVRLRDKDGFPRWSGARRRRRRGR
jgi:hypothetical protein